jgi:hypothetical protein
MSPQTTTIHTAIFGKTCENVRLHADVKLCGSPERFEKVIAQPATKSWRIFDKNFMGVNRLKTNVVLDKPVYVGFSVLELSKASMYRFHYEQIMEKYGEKATLLFTDTDSLCYLIETENIYDDMKANGKEYDMSAFNNDYKT